MKKFTIPALLAFLLSISFSLHSQEYISFPPDPTSEYRINYQSWNPNPWEITYGFSLTYFEGDTLVGNTLYHIKYSDVVTHYYPPGGGPMQYNAYHHLFGGAMRTEGSKVWFWSGIVAPELVFDYSWNVGDTLAECMISQYCDEPIIISSIDSIQIMNRYHLRYNFEPEYPEEGITYFIEGIGHDFGIYQIGCARPDFATQLICYSENGDPVFPDTSNCDLPVGIETRDFAKSNIKIFPNPAKAYITLETNTEVQSDVTIHTSDLTGRKLLTIPWSLDQGNNTIRLNLSSLKPGLYFVTISGNNPTSFAQQKLIVK